MTSVFIIKREMADDAETIEVSSSQERADAVMVALPINDMIKYEDKYYALEIEVDALYSRLNAGAFYYSVRMSKDGAVDWISLTEYLPKSVYVFSDSTYPAGAANIVVGASTQAEAIERAKIKLTECIISGEFDHRLAEYRAWLDECDKRTFGHVQN